MTWIKTYFRELVISVIVLLAALLIWRVPGGLEVTQARVLGVVLVTLGLWATGLVPGYVASIFFFSALLLAGLVPREVVFSGFSSAAMWLVVSGFVIGAAITHSGLGARVGAMARPHLSHSYPVLLAGLMGLSMALGFLMPSSMGRAAVMVPVGMALADVLGLQKGSRGRTGVAVLIAFATNMPSFAILPSNIPNVVLSGMAEQVLGVHFGYGDYLWLHYPVLGLVKSAVIVALVMAFFPARLDTVAPRQERSRLDRRQAGLLAILAMVLVLWATDQWHGINPAWVGLGASLILLLPRLGFVPVPVFKKSVDFGVLLFVAGALGLGAVVNATGLGPVVAARVSALLPLAPGHDFANFLSLVVLGTVTSTLTTMPGVPAVLTPLAPSLASASGFSPEAVLMTQVLGFSNAVFPYQIGPLIVAMGLAGESTRPLLKMTLSLTALTFLLFVPLDFLWWKLLGVI